MVVASLIRALGLDQLPKEPALISASKDMGACFSAETNKKKTQTKTTALLQPGSRDNHVHACIP